MQKNLFKRHTTKSLATGIAVLALLVFGTPGLGWAAYSEPGASLSFPQYDTEQIPELLNGSLATQTMLGSLSIGQSSPSSCPTGQEADCSRLCLNAPLITGVYPDTNDLGTISKSCITSWTGLAGLIINSTTSVRKLVPPFTPPRIQNNDSGESNDTVDNGAISLQADSTLMVNSHPGQLISLLAEAPDTSGSTSIPTAISADGGGLLYAATFAGRLAIMSDPTRTQQLCLNSVCKTNWSDLGADINPAIVRLQNLNTTDNRYPDPGLTDVSGIVVTQAVMAGGPTPATAVWVTCGNGMCDTINGETIALCPADCRSQ